MDYYLESTFFNNRHPQGLKIIETGIQTGDFSNIGYLCEYGQAASHLEPELISYLNKTNNIMDIYGLVELLGCVGSKLSVKHLIALYNPNDWELQRLIIRTLKKIDPDEIYTEQFFAAALKSTWSEIIRKEITSDMEQLNCFYEESEDGAIVEFCEEPWSIKTRMGSGPNDHGMQKCVNVAEYSYDKESWFTVEWLESDHSIVPDGFPDFLLSERFKHSLLPLDNGWIFSSDHGHYGGSLYYWSGDLDSSYYILPWTDAFKVLKHQGRILALGYSILLSNTDGDLFEIKKDINDQWIAEIILNLPAEPNRYGYDLEGELLIADHWNHYGVKNNQITPLFCRGVKF
jgi:hypothetical protein